jgi:hypothetical protein
MKTRLATALILLFLFFIATPALAHRLDEYLQATTFTLGKDHIVLEIHLTPGVKVFSKVIAAIDTDGNGVISAAEQHAYADQVRRDLTVTVDGNAVQLRLLSATFPTVEAMKEGLGDVVLDFDIRLPSGGPHHKLIFENHHERKIGAYLVNCFFPRDPAISVTTQTRNYQQSFYQLDYSVTEVRPSGLPFISWTALRSWLVADSLVLFGAVACLWWRGRRNAMPETSGSKQVASDEI